MLLRPHVYIWRHALETSERVQPAVGAEYAFKLRTAGAVARVRVRCLGSEVLSLC